MGALEDKFEAAVSESDISGAVLVASDAKGEFYYEKAFGFRSLKEGDPKVPLKTTDAFWLASSTKLMTSIAALQCVERGQFTLDEDVTRLILELKDIDILKGFEEGSEKPILVKATKKITLRHLLTHTSGLGYDVFSPVLTRWRHSQGQEVSFTKGSLVHRYTVPLQFEPGELWEYSGGIDWAGQMVERANGMSLENYMEKHVWGPLGITSMTFHPEKRPELLATIPEMSARQGGLNMFGTVADTEAKVAWIDDKVWALHIPDDNGGAGCYGRATDYVKVLRSITADDGKLLGSSMLEELFKPQLSESAKEYVAELRKIKELNDIQGLSVPETIKTDHSLGGVVVVEDVEGRRRNGTMFWAGLPNVFWWADRKGGLCGIYASQLTPTADPHSLDLFAKFEGGMYEQANKSKE